MQRSTTIRVTIAAMGEAANRLEAGQVAPEFTASQLDGSPVRLKDFAGKTVWLAFFRWAHCPLCNFRIHELLSQWSSKFADPSLVMLGVFQSPATKLEGLVERHKPPFIPIPDPEMTLFEQYHLGTSMKGMLGKDVRRALAGARKEGIPLLTNWDGPPFRTPADFLIDPTGVIRVAYYGENMADHIPFDQVSNYLEG
jgi:thioredoxin-dependent peroxiredoxin